MAADIRIPTQYILELAERIQADAEFTEMTWVHDSGNVLVATRKRGPKLGPWGPGDYDSWDFIYNPGD